LPCVGWRGTSVEFSPVHGRGRPVCCHCNSIDREVTAARGKSVNASNAAALTVHVIPPHPLAPDDKWMASFPLRTFMEYGAYRTAPGSARGLTRNALQEWQLGAFEEKASLVVTELTTNSVIATEKVAWEAGRPPVRLWLLAGPEGV